MFELKGITKAFGDTQALHSTDLTITPQKTTVLIGQSGCGKSTLIRLMVGLVLPDAGTIAFEGQALTLENAPVLRRKMGYVIQEGGLFPHLTAKENVCLMASYLGEPEEKTRARLEELRELTGFPADGLDRYPAELSGGQRQRVSLMRAVMLDPDVLLLDEPLGALDPMIRANLQSELRDIFDSLRKTVVIVTHDIGEAGYFGHEIVLMRDGRILQTGSLEDLVNRPTDDFVTQFINAQRSPLESLRD
jgi:osmoprotectant transport system ATP-binding protein